MQFSIILYFKSNLFLWFSASLMLDNKRYGMRDNFQKKFQQ